VVIVPDLSLLHHLAPVAFTLMDLLRHRKLSSLVFYDGFFIAIGLWAGITLTDAYFFAFM